MSFAGWKHDFRQSGVKRVVIVSDFVQLLVRNSTLESVFSRRISLVNLLSYTAK